MEIVAQLTINTLSIGAIYALMALGFNLSLRASRFFNIAHGVYAVVGAYGVYYTVLVLGLTPWIGVPIGIVAAGVVAYLSDLLVFRPMQKKKATHMTLLVASLGLFLALQAGIAILFGSEFRSLRGPEWGYGTFNVFGASITTVQIIAIVTALLATLGLYLFLTYTRFGKSIKAISDDIDVARIVGIDADKTISWVFVISGALAALGGILIGYDAGIMPISGLLLVLGAITASLIGGLGNYWSGLLGALILAFVENFGAWHIGTVWRPTIAFGLLILFLLFRPQGLFKQ